VRLADQGLREVSQIVIPPGNAEFEEYAELIFSLASRTVVIALALVFTACIATPMIHCEGMGGEARDSVGDIFVFNNATCDR
jgi:hypothetical protein